MKTFVAVRLGIFNVVLDGNNIQVLLILQHLTDAVDVRNERACNPYTCYIVNNVFNV
ncbi:hypothetical protein D3C80_1402870 [compost metagenome]